MPESRSIPVPVASRPPRTLSSLPAVATVASAPISERRVGPAPAAARRWAACASGGAKWRGWTGTPRGLRYSATAARGVAGVNSRIQPSSRARISSRPDTRHLLLAPSAVYPLSGAHAPRDGEIHLRLVRRRRPVIAPVALVFVTLYDAEERCDL